VHGSVALFTAKDWLPMYNYFGDTKQSLTWRWELEGGVYLTTPADSVAPRVGFPGSQDVTFYADVKTIGLGKPVQLMVITPSDGVIIAFPVIQRVPGSMVSSLVFVYNPTETPRAPSCGTTTCFETDDTLLLQYKTPRAAYEACCTFHKEYVTAFRAIRRGRGVASIPSSVSVLYRRAQFVTVNTARRLLAGEPPSTKGFLSTTCVEEPSLSDVLQFTNMFRF
jgi:hypothetical protein